MFIVNNLVIWFVAQPINILERATSAQRARNGYEEFRIIDFACRVVAGERTFFRLPFFRCVFYLFCLLDIICVPHVYPRERALARACVCMLSHFCCVLRSSITSKTNGKKQRNDASSRPTENGRTKKKDVEQHADKCVCVCV